MAHSDYRSRGKCHVLLPAVGGFTRDVAVDISNQTNMNMPRHRSRPVHSVAKA